MGRGWRRTDDDLGQIVGPIVAALRRQAHRDPDSTAFRHAQVTAPYAARGFRLRECARRGTPGAFLSVAGGGRSVPFADGGALVFPRSAAAAGLTDCSPGGRFAAPATEGAARVEPAPGGVPVDSWLDGAAPLAPFAVGPFGDGAGAAAEGAAAAGVSFPGSSAGPAGFDTARLAASASGITAAARARRASWRLR